ncbi:hypothetical protein CVIRNUC_002856 [Coccomyxa viridis]|uniref:U6 snRNA-associated Sm-like protein LSm8 n=1 Tax=Coccomyxa viridis TaxID=1274662 RepID=A0AAV1I058_9CHLO|nr:hypothetical protein CVIRNUC_002856 [Coccomyxa viridis]
MGSVEGLADLVDSAITVITCDGRIIVGILRGLDQMTNLILAECQERVFSSKAGVELVPLSGLHVIRGDNIAVVGEIDEDKENEMDVTLIRAPPLRPVTH